MYLNVFHPEGISFGAMKFMPVDVIFTLFRDLILASALCNSFEAISSF
jgi:hypothetical protein